ncbi:hypothetical protein [Actinomadura sp. 7K507]|uniref:hypothetical protein n=1 Tax=Actinomadura sp. 7K507 TaxID=2530365 RepID=UPI00104AFF9E|nr:hypothetical protein [Actinomadura sp. 7K507]TDC78549.1 hypothetical protein E1285_37225 [Actinomadura sp. 7K507]
MTAAIVLCFVLAAGMAIVGCLDQRKLYWKTASWQYRNPEANEPSDAALAMNRIGMFVGATLMIIIAGILMSVDGASTYSTAQVKAVAYAAESKVGQGSESGIGSSYRASSGVYDAVNEEGGGNVEIRSAGGGKYELTNSDGENPVCLTVEVDNQLSLSGDGEPWSHSVSTSVTEGPC